MGIFGELKSRNDPLTVKGLNQFLRFSVRLAQAKTKIQFLQECIQNNEFPHHYWKILRRHHIQPNAKSLKRHTRNNIDTIKSKIDELSRNLAQREDILDDLSCDDYCSYKSYVQSVCDKRCSDLSCRLSRALNPIKPQLNFPEHPERYVHNYSSTHLSPIQLQILSLGPKFCSKRSYVNRLETEIQFENLISQTNDLHPTSDLEMDHFRSTVLDCCKQYVTKPIRTRGLLSRQHITELKDLKNNSNIVICRPDKGSGIVLMNKEDYIKKLEDILQDETKFHKCTKEKDKTTSVENDLNKLLHKMHKDLLIDSETLEKLKPSGCTIPRLYGLPKVHKQGIPLRPVLDMYNSPYHAIAKWTSKLLEPVRKV